jgi:D-psicose/D-tagatose/L-ribulose 3-epimerase
MNKIGIYFAYWTDRWAGDERYYIEKAARLGFDQLELCPADMLDRSDAELAALRNAAEKNELTLSFCIGFGRDVDLASPNPNIRANGQAYFRRILHVVNRCGARILGGIIYSAWPLTPDEELTDKEAALERSAVELRKIAPVAADYGIDLCLEVVNRFEQYLLNTAEEGVAFCSRVGHPNVKLLLDTFHMNIEEDSFAEAIRTAGPRLGHFHIGETNRRVPGRGKMPWQEICQALKDIQYPGSLVMEPFLKMGGDVGRDIKVWRDLSSGFDETGMDREAQFALSFIRGCMQ